MAVEGPKGHARRSEVRTRGLGDEREHLYIQMVILALPSPPLHRGRGSMTHSGEVDKGGQDALAATAGKTKVSLSCFQIEGCVEVSEL